MSNLETVRESLQKLHEVSASLEIGEVVELPVITTALQHFEGTNVAEEVRELLLSVVKYGDMNSSLQLHSILTENWRVSNCHGPDSLGKWVVALTKFPQRVVSNVMNYVSEFNTSLPRAWALAVLKAYRQELRLKENEILRQSLEVVK